MSLPVGADLPELSRVAVLGLARSGLAAVWALLARGVEVVASDLRTEVPGLDARDGLTTVLGSHPESLLDGVQLVVLSPGIPRTAPIVDAALARAIPVVSEIELASRLLPGLVVAITGTNGKSTTTALAAALLHDAGIRAVACGNLGTPWIASAARREEELPPPTRVWVVELSSFQLETVRRFAPDVAVHLNLTPDHLDRYRSLDDYGAAKARIFENQQEAQVAVLNADDPLVARISPRARRFEFTRRRALRLGAWCDGDDVVADVGAGPVRILRTDELSLPGAHNLENALAALSATLPLGVPPESAARTLRSFKGLRHRTELIRVLGGVAWYNDSKGTNIDATLKSLEGFPDGRVFLILGGKDKGDDFRRLQGLAGRKARRILAIGKTAPAVEAALAGVPTSRAGTLDAAIAEAARDAVAGDVVLLSPACASFDQFRDFEHRGEVFEALVRALPDAGEEGR